MRSGITRRWLRGSLLITVLLVLLAETMFLYNYTRSYYNSVQQTMYRRFSSVSGQLKMYTGDTVQSTAATRSVALRRMVEQFADKDKYEFMLLDSYGGVIASSSGTNADGIVTGIDFEQAQEASDGLGVAVYRTQSGELVMAACYLVPYAAEDVAAMRLVTSLTLVGAQIKNAIAVSVVIAAVILAFTVMSGLYFIRSIVVPLGQVERTAASIARGELDVRLPVTGNEHDEVDRLRGTINQMAEGLEETEKMKNEFISSVSHELRTPIASIRGLADALNDGLVKKDEDKARYYGYILRESMRLSRLIDDLLELSRLQSGTIAFKKQFISINDLIEDVADRYVSAAREKGLNVEIDIGEPYKVYTNPDRAEQVLVALTDNAIKYGYSGTLRFSAEKKGDSLYISVSNPGSIADEDIDHVFERFYKADKYHAGQGTGLGLSIVNEVLELLGERIWVKSENGTVTFTFTLSTVRPDKI